jgi:hypothetical protein
MDIWRIRPTGGAPERITFHNSRVSYPTFRRSLHPALSRHRHRRNGALDLRDGRGAAGATPAELRGRAMDIAGGQWQRSPAGRDLDPDPALVVGGCRSGTSRAHRRGPENRLAHRPRAFSDPGERFSSSTSPRRARPSASGSSSVDWPPSSGRPRGHGSSEGRPSRRKAAGSPSPSSWDERPVSCPEPRRDRPPDGQWLPELRGAPVWSPDGRSIVTAANQGGSPRSLRSRWRPVRRCGSSTTTRSIRLGTGRRVSWSTRARTRERGSR